MSSRWCSNSLVNRVELGPLIEVVVTSGLRLLEVWVKAFVALCWPSISRVVAMGHRSLSIRLDLVRIGAFVHLTFVFLEDSLVYFIHFSHRSWLCLSFLSWWPFKVLVDRPGHMVGLWSRLEMMSIRALQLVVHRIHEGVASLRPPALDIHIFEAFPTLLDPSNHVLLHIGATFVLFLKIVVINYWAFNFGQVLWKVHF
jgi:hypothetical protein